MIFVERLQTTISYHLKGAGLRKGRKEGIEVHYKLTDPGVIINWRSCRIIKSMEKQNGR